MFYLGWFLLESLQESVMAVYIRIYDMKPNLSTPHHQFADFFEPDEFKPYAFGLSRKLEQGSVCLDLNSDLPKMFEEYDCTTSLPKKEAVAAIQNSGLAAMTSDVAGFPFILEDDRLYITRYYNYEQSIVKGISELLVEGKREFDSRLEALRDLKAFRELEKKKSKQAPDWQLVASVMAFLNNFTIITGGPGTGKTTTVAKVLSLLFEQNPEAVVKLAAPTGKAAMRMKEALQNNDQISEDLRAQISQLEPNTLHRLLGTRHQSPYFKHDENNKVAADVIIVDEASMIDVALFAKLIKAVPSTSRLILLGDQNQLTSVEAGSLLGDLCNSVGKLNLYSHQVKNSFRSLGLVIQGAEEPQQREISLLQDHIVELTYSWRTKDHPQISHLSKAVIHNRNVELKEFLDNKISGTEVTFDKEYTEAKFNSFIDSYSEYINETNIKSALDKLNNQRVLAVIRKGNQGVAGLNARIEKYLQKKKLINPHFEFYDHRPVMVTTNHPDLGLFNGDVGIVRKEGDKRKIWFLDQNGEPKGFSPGYLTDVETVFAMTVHKSQGSEFDNVLVVMPKSEDLELLTRELLYTAVTRAKKRVVVQGADEVILLAAKKQVRRASGITERLNKQV